MEKEFKIDLEIAEEIRRLEELYQHYNTLTLSTLYFRLWFFCCSKDKAENKYQKDYYGKKLKEMKELQISRL